MGMNGVTSVMVLLKERVEGMVRVVEEVAGKVWLPEEGIVWLPAAGWEGLLAPFVMALERKGSNVQLIP